MILSSLSYNAVLKWVSRELHGGFSSSQTPNWQLPLSLFLPPSPLSLSISFSIDLLYFLWMSFSLTWSIFSLLLLLFYFSILSHFQYFFLSLYHSLCLCHFATFATFVHLNLRIRKGHQLSHKYVSFVNMQTLTVVSNLPHSLPLPSHTRGCVTLFWISGNWMKKNPFLQKTLKQLIYLANLQKYTLAVIQSKNLS